MIDIMQLQLSAQAKQLLLTNERLKDTLPILDPKHHQPVIDELTNLFTQLKSIELASITAANLAHAEHLIKLFFSLNIYIKNKELNIPFQIRMRQLFIMKY